MNEIIEKIKTCGTCKMLLTCGIAGDVDCCIDYKPEDKEQEK